MKMKVVLWNDIYKNMNTYMTDITDYIYIIFMAIQKRNVFQVFEEYALWD